MNRIYKRRDLWNAEFIVCEMQLTLNLGQLYSVICMNNIPGDVNKLRFAPNGWGEKNRIYLMTPPLKESFVCNQMMALSAF